MELGFRIPIVSEILRSLCCILDSKAPDSGFRRQNFQGFRISQAKISPGFRNPNSLTWGEQAITLHFPFAFLSPPLPLSFLPLLRVQTSPKRFCAT